MTLMMMVLSAALPAQAVADASNGRLNVLPHTATTIFVARIVDVHETPWASSSAAGIESRDVEVKVQVTRVIKADNEVIVPGAQVRLTVPQKRRASGRIAGGLPYWSYQRLRVGDSQLVFSEIPQATVEGAFVRPVATLAVRSDAVVVDDVAFVAEGARLKVDLQVIRLTKLLEKPRRIKRSFFLGRYLSALVLSDAGARAPLINAAADFARLPLDDEGKNELLRTLHIGLLMQEHPDQDAVAALLSACVQSLSAADLNDPRLAQHAHAAVTVYLPWIVRSGLLKSASNGVADRAKAARTLRALGERAMYDRMSMQRLANVLTQN